MSTPRSESDEPASPTLRTLLRDLPDKPGCYLMRDRAGRIIYVGKATSLRRRVQSYFRPSTLAKAPPKLRSLIHSVASLETVVTRNEAEALLTEGRLIKQYKPRYNVVFRDDKRYLALRAEMHLDVPRFSTCRIVRDDGNPCFGPFPSAQVVRAAKDFVEKHFGIRKCTVRVPDEVTYRHCLNEIIAHCAAPCVGHVTPADYRARFDAACEFLRGRRPEVLATLAETMQQAAEEQEYERAASLRDTLLALREMVAQRARARETPALRHDTADEGVRELERLLELPRPPRIIEAFDISHLGGTFAVASLVVAVEGRPTPARYRQFRIQTAAGGDDPGSMAEVVRRRYSRVLEEHLGLPDLVLIDGGVTQLRAAREALARLGLDALPAVGLAKRLEEIVRDDDGPPLLLPRDSSALKVLMRLRDEAHRFAVNYNRGLRSRRLRESVLDEIEGVGPKRKTLLLRHFGSVRRLTDASVEDIAAVGGMGRETATVILETLKRLR